MDYYRIKTSDVLPYMIFYLTERSGNIIFKDRILEYLITEDVDVLKNWPDTEALFCSENEVTRAYGVSLIRDYYKGTALISAVKGCHLEIIRLLLEHGAKIKRLLEAKKQEKQEKAGSIE